MIKSVGINRIIYIVMAWLCFFSPLSNNGVVNSTTVTVLQWGILLLMFTLLICINGIDNNAYIIAGFIIIYLFCATVVIINKKQEFEFSIARLIPMLSGILVCSINYKNMRDRAFLERGLDCVIIAIVLVNILVFIQNSGVLKWIGNYYTQYLPNITEYHLSLKKPLSFFGVHNQAAFIYCGLYIISNLLYQYTLKKKI